MNRKKIFFSGFKQMIPITTGIVPFGAVVGTVSANAGLSFFQTTTMNLVVYAGASQLAAIDLMKHNAAVVIVVATGLVINLRFLLYSAALSPVLQESRFLTKLACAYSLTDQSYAVMSANQEKLKTNSDAIVFYFGATLCMLIAWQGAVMAGFVFGNFAPKSLALDYAIPLSFIALVMPSLKNKKYLIVALFSSIISILLNELPLRMSLIITAALSILLAMTLTKKRVPRDRN